MKKRIYIVCLLSSFSVFCQNTEKKSITSKSTSLLLEFSSVEEIRLNVDNSANKVTISYLNTTPQNVPEISDVDGTIHIKATKKTNNLKGVEKNKYRAGQPLYPSYVLNIPKDMKVQLFYDKGNFKTTNFNGGLDVHLDAGSVLIGKFEGNVQITSFSGLIACKVNSAELNIQSKKGKIVSHLGDARIKKTSTSLKGIYANAKNVLKINTIHGKVILKPTLTQK